MRRIISDYKFVFAPNYFQTQTLFFALISSQTQVQIIRSSSISLTYPYFSGSSLLDDRNPKRVCTDSRPGSGFGSSAICLIRAPLLDMLQVHLCTFLLQVHEFCIKRQQISSPWDALATKNRYIYACRWMRVKQSCTNRSRAL